LTYLRQKSYRLKFPVVYKIERNGLKAQSFAKEINELKKGAITKEEFERRITLNLSII